MTERTSPLLAPDTRRIGRPPGSPHQDRAPDSLASGTPEPLRGDLVALLGEERVLSRAIDLVAYASDASPYRRLPAVVVMAHDAGDVGKVLSYARATGTPVNFRGGGTSLSGQAGTDGIMIDVRRWLSGVKVLDGGARARIKAGTLLGLANRQLARRGFKLGPDPASKDIATLGGVIANNSGGMRCGVTWDSYSTVESMTLVLASGTVIDTAAPDAEARFAAAEPELAQGLLELREQLLADDALARRVRRKYEIKNVTGYRLCALLDAEQPLEIFRRLVVGSEGTLAFVAEAVMRTRPEPAHTTLAWVHFADLDAAAAAVPELVAAGARATELLVAPALIAAAWNMPGTPEHWRELPFESAVLMVELGGADAAELDAGEAAVARILAARELIQPHRFTRDHEEIELAWTVREGLFGLVGRLRALGTSLIIEDVCVAPERIAECARRSAGAARQARVPHRRRRTRLSRQPALPADPRLLQARGPPALSRLHGGARRVDRLQVRRIAEGRARHRREHGPVRRTRVGRHGDGDDVADQGARRPARRAQPRRGAQPGSRRSTSSTSRANPRSSGRPRTASSAASASRCARAATRPPPPVSES